MWLILIILYLSFIGLGMSDSLLGASWPSMNAEYLMPVSYAGISSAIVAAGKIAACLTGDLLHRKFGETKVLGISISAMALGLLGIFGVHHFWALLFFSLPLGLGSGYLNVTVCSYVALHYESRYNSWLQCMWSIGGSMGPMLAGWCIAGPAGWSLGYLIVGILEILIASVVFMSRAHWKRTAAAVTEEPAAI